MSGTAGHVTRKDGRIVDLPDKVTKILKWTSIIAYLVPAIMLLVSFGDHNASVGTTGGVILSIFPVGILLTIGVAILREGNKGVAAYAGALTMANYMALAIAPETGQTAEMLLVRLTPAVIVTVVLFFFREDLHYNLRPFWYSVQAMKELQEMMMKNKMRKEAKKRGEDFDEDKVMDADAIIRAVQAQTGQDIPVHMRGVNPKKGFRQESQKKQSGGGGKARRKRK